jgi:hypothetical protein
LASDKNLGFLQAQTHSIRYQKESAMNTQTESNLATTIDQAIDHALRLMLVSADNDKEPESPTGSGTYHPIEGVEESEFFECSSCIKGWNIEIYLAYLGTRISILSTILNSIESQEQRNDLTKHIERLQALHTTLTENKVSAFAKKRSFTEYLSPEQQELVHLSEGGPVLFDVLQDFAKPFADACGQVASTLSDAKKQAKSQRSSGQGLWSSIKTD